ncbi:MAG: AAA family ATPase [Prevotellaceae bacterium]|nr:AAA family ATPase [Prevotellaceae bacterium]
MKSFEPEKDCRKWPTENSDSAGEGLKPDVFRPVLFIFSGLPASGKSALAKLLAGEYRAVYLRIDSVEQGLRDICGLNVQGEGYGLSYRVAADNLKLGNSVVADSCNPIRLTRSEWQEVAMVSGSLFVNIEAVCSDEKEHRKRVETRLPEVEGLILPAWEEIKNREYHLWDSERIVIDTAGRSAEESFQALKEKIRHLPAQLPEG